MKRLNNKGVTLVELIVSFAIVAVAIIYFFQTLYTVKTLYTQTMNETNEYVMKDYGLRLANEMTRMANNKMIDYDTGKQIGYISSCDSNMTGTKCCQQFRSSYKKGVKTTLYKYNGSTIKSYTIYVCTSK